MAEIVVVGAGAIGLCCAWALADDGHAVTLVEARTVGCGASRVNVGWFTPSLSTPVAAPGMVLDRTSLGARPSKRRPGDPPARGTDWLRWLTRFRSEPSPAFSRGVEALLR